MLSGLPPQTYGSMGSTSENKSVTQPRPDIRPLYGVEIPPGGNPPPKPDGGGKFGAIMMMMQTIMALLTQLLQMLNGKANQKGGQTAKSGIPNVKTGAANQSVQRGSAASPSKTPVPAGNKTSTNLDSLVGNIASLKGSASYGEDPSTLDDDIDKPITYGGKFDAGRGKTKPTGNVLKAGYRNPFKNPAGAQNTPIPNAFQVVGRPEFQKRVLNALHQIKSNTPNYYKMVYSYIGRFKEVAIKTGFENAKDMPTYNISFPQTKDPAWLESIIVHDSWHSVQQREGMFSQKVGDNVEKNALDIQYDYLEKIGEPELAQYVLNLDGSHWRTI